MPQCSRRVCAFLSVAVCLFGQAGAAASESEDGAPEDDGLTLEGVRQIEFDTSEGTWLSLDVSASTTERIRSASRWARPLPPAQHR